MLQLCVTAALQHLSGWEQRICGARCSDGLQVTWWDGRAERRCGFAAYRVWCRQPVSQAAAGYICRFSYTWESRSQRLASGGQNVMLASPPYFGGSPCSIARMSFQSLHAITMQGVSREVPCMTSGSSTGLQVLGRPSKDHSSSKWQSMTGVE